MTSTASPPAGQQQAPGPPYRPASLASGSAARNRNTNAGQQTAEPNYNPGMDLTASLVVGDRSRDVTGAEYIGSDEPDSFLKRQVVLELAGPMRDWDPLYVPLIFLAFLTCICTLCAIFLPYSFTFHKITGERIEKTFSLFDSKPCSSYKDSKTSSGHKEMICFGKSHRLGIWVLVMQIFSCIGLGLAFLTLIAQLVNLCCTPRSKLLHAAGLYLMAAAGSFLVIAGHIGHNRSVWASQLKADGIHIRTEALGNGLFLLCSVLAGWSCVISHVSAHAPGPLSTDTRFAHTFAPEPEPAHELDQEEQDAMMHSILKDVSEAPILDSRRGSNLSTTV